MAKTTLPPRARLRWQKAWRIVPIQYPPIDLFERLDLKEQEKRDLVAALSRVDPGATPSVGDLGRVRAGDMIAGPLSSVVMAPFLYGRSPTRFSTGDWGVYYAARTLATAIRETVYHTEREARLASLAPQAFHRRAYTSILVKPFYNVRGPRYADLHRPDDYHTPQHFVVKLKKADPDAWGLVYRSVRDPGGDCVAALRPPAVSLPAQGPHLFYAWDGAKITDVFEQSKPLLTFR